MHKFQCEISMEEEPSFFERERDRLSREITAVRRHDGPLEWGLKCRTGLRRTIILK